MICRLCLEDKKLIDAHIIPRGFYKYLYPDESEHPGSSKKSLLTIRADGRNLNSWIGEYDQNILCNECDNKLGKYDDYGQTILLKTAPENISDLSSQIKSVDYKQLKLFFISLLWRASISTREFFNQVNVGHNYEEMLRKMIINEDPGEDREFAIIFTQFKNTNTQIKDIADRNITIPMPFRIASINGYIFYFPYRFKIYIKVDKRPFPEELNKVALSKNGPLLIINAGDFQNSIEFKKILEVRALFNTSNY